MNLPSSCQMLFLVRVRNCHVQKVYFSVATPAAPMACESILRWDLACYNARFPALSSSLLQYLADSNPCQVELAAVWTTPIMLSFIHRRFPSFSLPFAIPSRICVIYIYIYGFSSTFYLATQCSVLPPVTVSKR